MSLIVYGANVSPFVRKVRTALFEKKLEYKLEYLNIFSPPDWFETLSPLKRIPILKDLSQSEDIGIPDSSAICAYLDKQYPQNPLYPNDPFLYARALWYEEYADTELAATIGLGVFRPIVLRKLGGKEPDLEKASATLTERLPRLFDYLNQEISDKTFFVGDQLSIADIAVATHFVNFEHAGLTVDQDRWPALAAFIKHMHARESFKTVIQEESPLFRQPALKL